MRLLLHALKGQIRAASITLFLAIVLLLSLHALPQALEGQTIESDALSAGPATSQESDDDSDKKKDDEEEGKDDDDPEAKPKKKKKKAPARELSIEEQYVHKRLPDYLHADSLEFLQDGRVKMVFDFRRKNPDHEGIFTPRISPRINTVFGWSTGRGYYGYWGARGLRLANTGRCVLNCWFKNGVESEIYFYPGASHQIRQVMALTYTSKSGSLGSNFGSQCALFSRSGRIIKRTGEVVPPIPRREAKFKLKVKDGYFEAYLNNRKKMKAKYSERKFESGRVGLIWGGGMACFVSRMEITGHLDYAYMFKLLRKIPEPED